MVYSIVTDSLTNSPIFPMDDHIRLVFAGQAFCFSDRCFLQPVFGGDPFVSLPPDGPVPFMRDYVLVPGTASLGLTTAFEEEFNKFSENINPGSGIAGFWHGVHLIVLKILFSG